MNVPDDRGVPLRSLVAAEAADPDDPGGTPGALRRLCRVLVRELPAAGAGIGIATTEEGPSLWIGSDARSERLDESQFVLGEGPTRDAFRDRRPVLSLHLDRNAGRWPMFLPVARAESIASVYAFPVQIGASRLGTLSIYQEQALPQDRQALSTSLQFADLARDLLLAAQEGATDTEPMIDPHGHSSHLSNFFTAQGMVMIQLGVSLSEAAARLRAHAFATERSIDDVAQDVVARRLSFRK